MAKTELAQTKGQFKLMGKVKGISNENALKEGTTQNDAPYKSLSFFVETSPTNAIKVELFAMERDEVYFYSSKEKKTQKVKWAKRNQSIKEYKLIGVRLGLEKGADGKNKQEMMVEWDAVDYIVDNLKDGDSIFVNGTIDFQNYKDQQGNEKESKRYTISGISRTKNPIDFEAEDFSEMASFEQDIVVTDVMVDEKKLLIGAKIIGYKSKTSGNQTINDTVFVVDTEADGGKYKKLAQNMKKRLKFGDFIKVFGLCINSVETVEVEGADVEEDDWGGEMPSGQGETIRNYVQELRVTAVDSTSYEPKKYTEDDFFNEDEDNFGDDEDGSFEDGDDFGGDGFDDEEDEDLPFK